MDVKQIKAALSRGMVYSGMDRDLQTLRDEEKITSDEYYSLLREISRIESQNETDNTLNVEQVSSSREENTISKEEDDNVTALNTVSETVAEPVMPVVENESSTEAPAEETREEPQQEGQPASENSVSEDTETREESREDTNKDAPQWVSDYRNYMMEWSARNPERRLQKFEKEEESYKADFKDGVALNFSSPSNVAVKTADPESPKASDFDALIEIAKKSNQNIRLSDNMSDEFRKALIEACATADVKITNLSREDTELYLSFATKEEETTEQQDVVNDTEEDVVAPVNEEPVNEEPEAPAEEAEPVVETETPVVSDSTEENEPIAMPESFSEETLKDNSEELFGDLLTADTVDEDKENDSDSLFDLNYTPSEKEQTADPFKILFNNTEDSAEETPEEPVVEEPKAENSETPAETAPSGEIAAEEEGFFKRTFKKIKNKLPVWMVGLGSVGAVVAPSCNSSTQKGSQNTDGYEQYVDAEAEDTSDTYVSTAADFATTQAAADTVSVPTEWNESMRTNDGYSEDYFKIVKRFYEKLGYDWAKAYKNASTLSSVLSTEDHKFSALQILSGLYSTHFTLNVTSDEDEGSKGYANFDSGILAPYDLKTLADAILCNPKALNMENLNYYRCILSADEHGTVNLFTLSELNSRFSKLPHDEKGRAIGTKCNYVDGVVEYPCGAQKQVRYVLRDCDCGKKVTHTIQVALDTVQTPVVDTTTYVAPVEPVVATDTTQKTQEPEVKRTKPEGPSRLVVATDVSTSRTPLTDFTGTVNKKNSSLVNGSKRQAQKMRKELLKSGIDIDNDQLKEEINQPGISEQKALEQEKRAEQEYNNVENSTNTGNSTYYWPNNQGSRGDDR